jgi:hypothetical protein
MAKWNNASGPDAALTWYGTTTTILCACGTQPTTAAQATSPAYALGTIAYSSANFTNAAGDVGGGRKVTVTAATIALTASGTVNHFAFTGPSVMAAVATCAPTAVTSGGSIIMNSFDLVEIGTIT